MSDWSDLKVWLNGCCDQAISAPGELHVKLTASPGLTVAEEGETLGFGLQPASQSQQLVTSS